jgi:hypothetical protein
MPPSPSKKNPTAARRRRLSPSLPSAAAAVAAKEKSNCPPPLLATTVVCHRCHPLPPPSPPRKNPTVLHCRCQPPPSSVSTSAMKHPSKEVIHLEDDSSGNESVDSDVEEVVQWDRSLSSTKTFKTAVLILSGRKFESPNLESLQKNLHLFINCHRPWYRRERYPDYDVSR